MLGMIFAQHLFNVGMIFAQHLFNVGDDFCHNFFLKSWFLHNIFLMLGMIFVTTFF
jgi:hypothetical protein